MKGKPRASTLLILLLALVGLGVILYPTFNDLYFRWSTARELEQYNQVAAGTAKDYSEDWAAAEEYNRRLAAGEAVSDDVAQYLNSYGTGMMGYIDIPAIDVHLPIYQGTQETMLQSGVGYWLGSSLPTGGESTHCVLTAHSGLVKAKLFTDLEDLVIGDRFTLTVLDRELVYEVDQILVTEPEDGEPLEIIEGGDYVTLYTCTPVGVNTHRLLVRGCRVQEDGDAAESTSVLEQVQKDLRRLILLMGLVTLLLVLLLVVIIWKIVSVCGRGRIRNQAGSSIEDNSHEAKK